MFKVIDEISVEASHAIPLVGGELEEPHSHVWRLRVELSCAYLNPQGMAVDMDIVRAWLQEIVGHWDGAHLNDLPPFADTPATAEQVAFYVGRSLQERLTEDRVWVSRIECWMTDTGVAVWEP